MIRLFVSSDLKMQQSVCLNENQIHYLFHVMRMKAGENILLFNGRDGEYRAVLTELSKNKGTARCETQTRAQEEEKPLNVWLCFAPIKKDNMDFVVQKATELGVDVLCPVITKRTVCKANTQRMQAQAVEAAEQCERLSVPVVQEPMKWDAFLSDFPDDRTLYFLNERGSGVLSADARKGAAFLVGPEGGFDEKEVMALSAMPQAVSMHLGRRILRAETASFVALACYNQVLGWKT